MEGWTRELIDPINAILRPRQLVWKEKWGLIRVEWIVDPTKEYIHQLSDAGGLATMLEEASRLCCCQCGRWNGWMYGGQKDFTVVTTAAVRGWLTTLCQDCRDGDSSDRQC